MRTLDKNKQYKNEIVVTLILDSFSLYYNNDKVAEETYNNLSKKYGNSNVKWLK